MKLRRLECCFFTPDTKTCSSFIEILDFNGACFVAIISLVYKVVFRLVIQIIQSESV